MRIHPRIREYGVPASALALLATWGCAAIFSSGPTPLSFQSEPAGADVIVNGIPRGATPVTLQLEADESYIVTFRRSGCQDVTVPLETHVQAGFVVLDLLAGIIGIAIDAATGEWKEFNDRMPYARLECGPDAEPHPAVERPVAPPVEPVPLPRERVELAVPSPGGLRFAGGRWTGTLTPSDGSSFEATLTLNDVDTIGPAVAGLATYTRGRVTCVYRLTATTLASDEVILAQSLETPSDDCARDRRLRVERVSGGNVVAEVLLADGRPWASGLLRRGN